MLFQREFTSNMVKILKIKECTRVVLGYCHNPLGFGSIAFVIVVQRGYQ